MTFYASEMNHDVALVEKLDQYKREYWTKHSPFYSEPDLPPPRNKPRYPDFYLLGAQKGGTTWLMSQIAFHPQIWTPIAKELFYFDEYYSRTNVSWAREARIRQITDTLSTSEILPYSKEYIDFAISLYNNESINIDDNWYSKNFEYAGANQIVGDAIVTFPFLPIIASVHMKRLSPHSKSILILRNPVDRIWSHLRMVLPKSNQSVSMQMEILDRERNIFISMSDYSKIIRDISRVFSDGQILLLDYEDICNSPSTLLEKVCNFLGVAFDAKAFPYQNDIVFKGPDIARDKKVLNYIKTMAEDIVSKFSKEYPELTANWLERF